MIKLIIYGTPIYSTAAVIDVQTNHPVILHDSAYNQIRPFKFNLIANREYIVRVRKAGYLSFETRLFCINSNISIQVVMLKDLIYGELLPEEQSFKDILA